MSFIKTYKQIRNILEEIKTYPKGYEFHINEVLSISKYTRVGNWNNFVIEFYPILMQECVALGGNKFRKNN